MSKSNSYRLASIAAMAAMTLSAQNSGPNQVSVNAGDQAAGRDATHRRSHGLRSQSQAARSLPSAAFTVSERSGSSGSSNSGPGNGLERFPGDVSYGGGAVVTYAQSHAIYMNPVNGNCTIATCWGDPEGFLRDLGSSDFIHLTDQYVNVNGNNRYTVGQSSVINYVQGFFALTDNDILARVHAVAATTGQTGYGHIYHVFLPPGQDVCQSAGICFSTVLCAYHGSADFFDLGHVVYTVEPDQLGGGCAVAPGSPNGARVDSTNNVLSHEMFETITDPDFDGWFVTGAFDLLGQEIGDECEFYTANLTFFDVPSFKIGNKVYAVQREYSNKTHSCSTK